MTDDDVRITRGSDNVFEDLGFPDAVERLAKVDIAIAIIKEMDAQGMSADAAAGSAGVEKSVIADVRRLRLGLLTNSQLQAILDAIRGKH